MALRPIGNLNPELFSAVMTRSRDSLTAPSGKPTMTTTVSPQPELTSTSMGRMMGERERKGNAVFAGESRKRFDPMVTK